MYSILCTWNCITIPRFSPPQTSICVSYLPSFSKYALLMTNSPPAIIGVLMACVGSFCLACRSAWLRYSHLKTKLQSKPPLRSAEAPKNKIQTFDSLKKKYCLRRDIYDIWKSENESYLFISKIQTIHRCLRYTYRYIEKCPYWLHLSQDRPPWLGPRPPFPEVVRANRRYIRSVNPKMSIHSR